MGNMSIKHTVGIAFFSSLMVAAAFAPIGGRDDMVLWFTAVFPASFTLTLVGLLLIKAALQRNHNQNS